MGFAILNGNNERISRVMGDAAEAEGVKNAISVHVDNGPVTKSFYVAEGELVKGEWQTKRMVDVIVELVKGEWQTKRMVDVIVDWRT